MAVFWTLPIHGHAAPVKLAGHVYEMAGNPVVGATVALVVGDSTINGVACDLDGAFKLKLSADEARSLNRAKLEFSAIGFRKIVKPIARLSNLEDITVTLAPTLVKLDRITSSATLAAVDAEAVSGADITRSAQRSILSTNPIEAIRDASVTRSGSTLGSRIRFSGSSPQYSLNGQSLGADPAHYGMFAVLPGSAVSELNYTDHTARAEADSPTAVRMRSSRAFGDNAGGTLTLSALEATGSFQYGTNSAFLRGAVRESLLDKIIERVDVERTRQSIPPTDFQDLFVSGGLKASPKVRLFVDQYIARDELVYNTQGTALNSAGIDTRQKTQSTVTHLQAQRLSESALWNAHLGIRTTEARYSAESAGSDNPGALALDLHERGFIADASVDVSFEGGEVNWKFGASGRLRNYEDVKLQQRNWNFLPPEATSDVPHYFQSALNQLYGDVSAELIGAEGALFGEVERTLGSWNATAGLRAQKYDYLANETDLLWRLSAQRALADNTTLRLTAGTYAESPLGNILDPYQVLVRKQVAGLRSVRTAMFKSQLALPVGEEGRLDFSVFAKRITGLPALTAGFSEQNDLSAQTEALSSLAMKSVENRNVFGFSAQYRAGNILSALVGNRLELEASYAFTRTSAERNGAEVYVSEDAPHSLALDVSVRAGRGWQAGTLLTARTGYRYSEFSLPGDSNVREPIVNLHAGYQNWERVQNSRRFPAHVNINLSLSRTTGAFTTFFNVGNVFDRANPLVSLSDGFVYDAGILPSAGVTYSF